MTAATFRLELRRSRSLVVGMAVVTLAYGGIMAAMYPIMEEHQALLDEYMKVFPQEFLAAFGMVGGTLTDPGVFFNTYLGSMIWPVVAAIGGIILATRTAADADRGWLELPLASRLPRSRQILAGIAVQVLALALLAVVCVGGVVGVGIAMGADWNAGRFLLATPPVFAFGTAIAAVTTLLAVLTLSRGTSAGIAAGALLAMYLLNAIVTINPDLSFLAPLGIFNYLHLRSIIDTGTIPWGDLAVLLAVSALAWGAAVWRFRERDLLA